MNSPQDNKGKYYRVSAEWLKSLTELALNAEKEMIEIREGRRKYTDNTWRLIGFASSAETLLKYLHAEND